MATYDELLSASENGPLKNRIKVACFIAAEAIRTEAASTANNPRRKQWAAGVFQSPDTEADRMIWAVLAAQQAQTLANILAATDSQLQTAVNNAVNIFAQ